ncbi:hypothetical protein IEQ34_007253 [Dendrobium chrysotoxum]|uniref:Uncharacterized protein n=1 Tax=Dendrobium chrysotoxum TaxID=161865 RepID=A0AAV7H7R2_DENCH|nr:hypothetical protein IEQ34_007253 [Dendrobium chrysotoxum]
MCEPASCTMGSVCTCFALVRCAPRSACLDLTCVRQHLECVLEPTFVYPIVPPSIRIAPTCVWPASVPLALLQISNPTSTPTSEQPRLCLQPNPPTFAPKPVCSFQQFQPEVALFRSFKHRTETVSPPPPEIPQGTSLSPAPGPDSRTAS